MTRTRISRPRDEILATLTEQERKQGFVRIPCDRCGGTGYVGIWWVEGGRCFKCYGRQGQAISLDTVVQREQARDRREHHRAKREQNQRADEAERLENLDPRIAALAPFIETDEFAGDLYRNWVRQGELSDSQWEWVEKLPARCTEKAAERAVLDAHLKASRYVGEVGDRLPLQLTILKEIDLGVNRWGALKTLYKFEDERGNQFAWFTSAGLNGAADGDSVAVLATVKKHEEYEGTRQTIISRLKVQ